MDSMGSMFGNKTKIAVIGGGIIGTTSAMAIIDSIPNIEITLISEKFSPNTTSDGSGGLIFPYIRGNTDPKRFNKWVSDTIKYLNQQFMSPNAGKLGIGLLSMYILYKEGEEPEQAEDLIRFRDMSPQELKLFGDKWKKGSFVTTYYVESSKLIPYFLEKFKSKVRHSL